MFIENSHQYQPTFQRSAMFQEGARHCNLHFAPLERGILGSRVSINISSLRDEEIDKESC